MSVSERELVQPIIKFFSFIPQSDFVIDLDENEEIIWIADSVVRDDDIAYITVETTGETGELGEEPQLLFGWAQLSYKITARNWWGRFLFYAWARGWARFNWQGECTYVIDTCLCGVAIAYQWRYECTDYDHYIDGGVGYDYARITADAYFKDRLIRRNPHIYVWAQYPYPYGDGYLEWDS